MRLSGLQLLNIYLEYIVDQNLQNISAYDKALGTNFTREYKRFIWWNMREAQKPMLNSLFKNGRVWRLLMDKHLAL